ncbi:MAG: hypothetical protein MI922_10190, partial [Bacteroidales bacterium]|nr:hypothetical protein [Bacteroidales bacterium]
LLIPPEGRSLALYQNLSSAHVLGKQLPEMEKKMVVFNDLLAAYVIGKKLPDLPKDEAPGRKPDVLAKLLMDECL